MVPGLLNLHAFVRLAGLAQIVLALGSVVIPKILRWRSELAKVQPLIRQIFWVYAVYILVMNLSFGLVSFFDGNDLVNGSLLGTLLTGFITVYWVSRLSIQFFYFDRKNFPTGRWCVAGEIALVSVFVFLSATYAVICYADFQLLK